MAKTSKSVAAPTRGEAAIQEFANSSLTPEQLKQRAALLLNNKELLRDVQGLGRGDQAKFVDKVDQVGRGNLLFSPEIFPHYFCKGIPNRQLARCKIRNNLGGRM